jgi:hypothetical protein
MNMHVNGCPTQNADLLQNHLSQVLHLTTEAGLWIPQYLDRRNMPVKSCSKKVVRKESLSLLAGVRWQGHHIVFKLLVVIFVRVVWILGSPI